MVSEKPVSIKEEKVETYSANEVEYALEEARPGKFVYSPAEKKLVKKINWTVMPLVCGILFVQVIIMSYNVYVVLPSSRLPF